MIAFQTDCVEPFVGSERTSRRIRFAARPVGRLPGPIAYEILQALSISPSPSRVSFLSAMLPEGVLPDDQRIINAHSCHEL